MPGSMRSKMPLLWMLSALVMTACGGGPSTLGTPQTLHLTVQTQPFLSFAPLTLAEQEGYYQAHGLDVEFVRLDTPEAIVALSRGELDVAANFLSASVINAVAQGSEIRLVADKGYVRPSGCTVNAIVASRQLAESGELAGVEQLAGRTISIEPPTIEGYVVDQLLADAGMDLEDLEVVDVPPPAELDALGTGSLDLALVSEPWTTRIVESGNAVIWMPVEAITPDLQFAALLFGPSILEGNREAGNRFMLAYLQAVRQYNAGATPRNLRRLAASTELEEDFLRELCWPTFREDGRVSQASVVEFMRWGLERGYVDQVLAPDRIIDGSFVQFAGESLGDSSP